MNKPWRGFCFFALLAALLSCANPVKEYTPRAEFIFNGTIVVVKSSTINLEEVAEMAVVRVDRILDATDNFQATTGQLVTVRLKKPRYAEVGRQKTFFTRGWHFGSSLGVVEVGSMAVEEKDETDKLQKEIERVRVNQKERKLMELMVKSPLIVSGRVVAVRKAEDAPVMLSEHDPDWRVAEIRVSRTLKGKAGGETVKMMFANSKDVQWFRSPKYQEGMQGVWLLQKFEMAGRPLKHLTTLSPDQFRPTEEEPMLLKMIQGQ